MKRLQLASDLALPSDLVTETAAVLGRRGSGKTHTGSVLAEEMLKIGEQIVVFDPLDVWWGLASSASGKEPGLPVIVFGGLYPSYRLHGGPDLPLDADAAESLADLVVEETHSVILSIRHLSKTEQRSFVAAFAERLYHRKGEQGRQRPVHLIIDEADAFVPQRLFPGVERCFGAIDTLVRRGRSSGIGTTLISQRAAVVNKDVLTQTELLICHQTTSPHDRKALKEWIEANDDAGHEAEFMGSLASLGKGEVWVWSPGWARIFQRAQVRPRETFDSSATPKGNAPAKATPKKKSEVDLAAVKERLQHVMERAEEDDPAALRKRIRELEAALQRPPDEGAPQTPLVDGEPVRVFVDRFVGLTGDDIALTLGTATFLEETAERLRKEAAMIRETAARARERATTLGAADISCHPIGDMVREEAVQRAVRSSISRVALGTRLGEPEDAKKIVHRLVEDIALAGHGISQPQKRILDGLAWLGAVNIPTPTRVQVAFLAEQSPRSSGYRNNLSALRTAGFLVYHDGSRLALTEDGLKAATIPKARPSQEDLHQKILQQLPPPQARILSALIRVYPNPLDRGALADLASQSASSSGYRNNLSALRGLGLLDYLPGSKVKAGPVLFFKGGR